MTDQTKRQSRQRLVQVAIVATRPVVSEQGGVFDFSTPDNSWFLALLEDI